MEIMELFLEGWKKRKGKDFTKGISCVLLTRASSPSDLSVQESAMENINDKSKPLIHWDNNDFIFF